MTRRTILAAFLILCLLGAAALAQAPRPAAEQNPLMKIRRLVKFLEFTEEQIASLKDLLKQEQQALKPLRERMKKIDATLKEQLASQNPNPAFVGKLVIAKNNLHKQMATVRQAFAASFELLLTADQKAKLDEARAKRKSG